VRISNEIRHWNGELIQERALALTRLEAAVDLVDDIEAAAPTHHLVVPVPFA